MEYGNDDFWVDFDETNKGKLSTEKFPLDKTR
jgi:hypothetical protein